MNQTAQGLASFGRGPDSMLVHMAPGEVKSLQQLAMAHGGSLTINPETGLPEAGFLSSILPMLIGGGLSIASGGTLTPLMAAMMTGGGYAVATGSLKKGLMAGLGAYGGAGLGSALAGAGATTVGATANALGVPGAATGAGSQAAMLAAQNQGFGQAGLEALGSSAGVAQGAAPVVQSSMQSLGAGAQGLLSEQGRNAFMQNIGGAKGLMQSGLMAAAPMMMQPTVKQPEIKSDSNMGQRYKFDAGARTPTPTPDVPGYGNQGINFGKEQEYFNPVYTPIDDATAKKLYGFDGNDTAKKRFGFASGGPVEAMSNANSIGMNTGYPQADINTGAYATPYQQPISRNVVTGPQGAGIDPYTGQQQRIAPAPQAQFADGGEVDSYTYDPVTQMYTKKAGEGATMVSPIGGISKASGLSGSSGGGSAGDLDVGGNKNTQVESIEAQSARNQVFNDFVTGLSKMGPTSMLMSGINALFGAPNNYAPVSDAGTSLDAANTAQSMQSMQDALAADTAAAQGTTTGGISNAASSAADGYGTGDTAGFGGGTEGGGDGWAQGGITNLGDYSDGGRLLRGPGDGVSDDIPAMIGQKQQARLADGEFVVPARIVSELGNGSTEAGARQLYAMMDRVQKARTKTIGKDKVATNSRAAKLLPA